MKRFIFYCFFLGFNIVKLYSQEQVVERPSLNNRIMIVKSIDKLRHLTSINSKLIYVSGYYNEGDCGKGFFIWNPDCLEKDDGGIVIKTFSKKKGRFIRYTDDENVNPCWFGAKGNGIHNDTRALQKALDYASKQILNHQQSKIFRASVKLPPKIFLIDSIQLKEGVLLQGSGQFSTALIHTGKGTKFIYTDKKRNNRWIGLRDLSIRGKKTNTIGILLYKSNYDSFIDRVTISEFYDNIIIEDSWTIKITNSHIYKALRYNIFAKNPTAVIIDGNRIDAAGAHNIFIDESKEYKTTGIIISDNTIQQANKSGIYCKNTHSISIINNFLEANNKNGNSAFIEIEGFLSGSFCLVFMSSNTFTTAGKSLGNSYGVKIKNSISSFTSINDYFSPSIYCGIISKTKRIKSFNVIGTLFNSKFSYDLPSEIKINDIGSLYPNGEKLFHW